MELGGVDAQHRALRLHDVRPVLGMDELDEGLEGGRKLAPREAEDVEETIVRGGSSRPSVPLPDAVADLP